MAILQVISVAPTTGGEKVVGADGVIETRMTKEYLVVQDAASGDVEDILTAVDPNTGNAIPREGTTLLGNPNLIAMSLRYRMEGRAANVHRVTVPYTNLVGTLPDQVDDNPLLDAPVVALSSVQGESRAAKGYREIKDGAGGVEWSGSKMTYMNSAGDPFNNITRPEFDELLTVRVNQPLTNVQTMRSLIASWKNTINDATFLGSAKHTVKVTQMTAAVRNRNTFEYWEVVYSLAFRALTWIDDLRDMGAFHLEDDPDDADADRLHKANRNDAGNVITVPQDLDGEGNLLVKTGDASANDNPANVSSISSEKLVYIRYRAFEESDFSTLFFASGVT